jgi:hypothetical protein
MNNKMLTLMAVNQSVMFRKTLLLSLLPFVITLIYAAGGCRPTKARICRIVLKPASKDSSGFRFPQTRFAFVVHAGYDEFCLATVGNPVTSSCYAFTKCYALQNDIDTSSFCLTLSNRIWTATDTLEPGMDIMDHPAFRKYVPVSGNGFSHCKYLSYFIYSADTAAVQELMFEEGPYTVMFSCRTTDSVRLENFATITFR